MGGIRPAVKRTRSAGRPGAGADGTERPGWLEPIDRRVYNGLRASPLGDCGAPEALAGDASMRRYFRVHTPAGRYIVCLDATLAEAPAAGHQFMLGIPAGTTRRSGSGHCRDGSRARSLTDDLGDTLLEDRFPGFPRRRGKALRRNTRNTGQDTINSPGSSPVPFGRSFDMKKLMFEFDFFMRHAVKNTFPSARRNRFSAICAVNSSKYRSPPAPGILRA